MEREVIATFRAVTSKPDYLTVDKLDAGLGGWGSFNIGIWAAANVIAKEMQKGKRLKLEASNEAFTDVDDQNEEVMAEFLAQELNVPGYHRIDTQHVFHNISFAKKNLSISANGIIQKTSCEIKLVGDTLNPVSVSVEHDFLVEIQQLLLDKSNHYMSINELRKIIESKLRDPGDEITIEL